MSEFSAAMDADQVRTVGEALRAADHAHRARFPHAVRVVAVVNEAGEEYVEHFGSFDDRHDAEDWAEETFGENPDVTWTTI